jgi:deoxyribonuclease-4
MSITGGLHKALERAAALRMQTVQLFTASPQVWQVIPPGPAGRIGFSSGQSLTNAPNQWAGRPITPAEAKLFRETLQRTKMRFPTAHDSYLTNLASPDPALYRRSVEAFGAELQRAETLGLTYLVTHPGAHLGDGEAAGLDRIVRAIDEVHQRCAGYRVRILLETTAGQGTSLGHRFEHLRHIIRNVAEPNRLGVCLDTCHVFAAGYALAPEREYRATVREFAKQIGLKRLRAFHVNDSLKPLGCRVDRHAHIGTGQLGLEPFRLLVNDPRFRDRPMILETPKESEKSDDMDKVNLSVLRGLVAPVA